MLFFEGNYIDVGLIDYTMEFNNAMQNWVKYDYSYMEGILKKTLEKNLKSLEEENKKGKDAKFVFGHSYVEAKDYWKNEYLKGVDKVKKYDAERKQVEEDIRKRLHVLRIVTATVMTADTGLIKLGLKIGHVGYPNVNMDNDVLIIREDQEIVFHEDDEEYAYHLYPSEEGEILQEEATLLIWRKGLWTQEVNLRIIFSRPFKLKEWYQKLSRRK